MLFRTEHIKITSLTKNEAKNIPEIFEIEYLNRKTHCCRFIHIPMFVGKC